ncbi:uncharacterized protein LOC143217705 [Lasioglossum baleicum]|uniref:uncharacterized protein LOC143217705 n=1 Tax=Lasioglossum baleicum TaxID=434251 RepID=UPI003FCEBD3E
MNTSVIETFEAVLEWQNQAVSQLQKILSNTKKKGEANFIVPFLEARIKLFEDTWIEIRQLNGALQAARKLDPTKETLPYFQSDTMDRMEDFYLDGWTMLKQAISRLTISPTPIAASSPVSVSPTPVSSIQNIKLPKVELPTFSGDCAKWKPYESRSKSAIISNPSLTDSVKLQYLLGSLSGDALAAVENLDVIDSNFEIAWERLKENFHNERLIVHALMRKLFSLKSINMEQIDSLRQFTVHFRNTLEALHKLGRTSQDDLLVYLVTNKFEKTTAREWRDLLGKTRTYPTLKQLEEFLFTKAAAVEEEPEPKSQSVANAKRPGPSRPASTSHVVEETVRTRSPCSMCNDSHSLRDCKAFRKLSPLAHFEVLKNERVCINCLGSEHTVSNCPSTHVCRECGGRHHTLLHRGTPKASKQKPGVHTYDSMTRSTVPPQPSTATSTNCEARSSTSNANYDLTATHLAETVPKEEKTVLLATAIVKVYTPDGRTRLARALLDQGSQASFISNNLVQQLRLQKIRSPISVTGLGGEPASSINYSAQICIVRSITRYVPPPITVDDYREFTTLALADPNPASDQRIEILLGAELYGQIIRPGVHCSLTNGPIAQNTVFGWILSGPIRGANVPHPTITAHHGVTAASLEKALSRFWETEAVPEACSLTPQENQCEQHFTTTYSRDATGRFIVRLPFIKPIPDDFLGDSFRGAAASLKRLTTQLQHNDEVKARYTEFIREYVTLGHMTQLSSIDKTRTFIPHRAVLREESQTTKLRVVFNASHKTSSGYSINDLLHTGPKLQQDITRIILNWRLHEFVLVAHIEKMFRQIVVHSQDRKHQCILWENEKTHQLEAYELNTATDLAQLIFNYTSDSQSALYRPPGVDSELQGQKNETRGVFVNKVYDTDVTETLFLRLMHILHLATIL